MAKKEAKLSTVFQKGNFSCDLRNDVPTKTDFMKTHKGQLNVDISSLHDEIIKAKKGYDKASGKKSTESKS